MKKVLAVIGCIALVIASVSASFADANDLAPRAITTSAFSKTNSSIVVTANYNRLGGWIINSAGTDKVWVSTGTLAAETAGGGMAIAPGASITFNFTTSEQKPCYQGDVWCTSPIVNQTNTVKSIQFTK